MKWLRLLRDRLDDIPEVSLPVGIAAFLISGRMVQKRAGNRIRRWALSDASHSFAMWEGGVVSVRDTQSGSAAIFERGDNLSEFVDAAVESGMVS